MITLDDLVESIERDSSGSERLIVLLYGGPGSGKTTIAKKLVEKLNAIHPIDVKITDSDIELVRQISGKHGKANKICQYKVKSEINGPFAAHIKMDGFHLPLSMLTPDQVKRRGSPPTFDSQQVVELLKFLLQNNWDLLSIPDFDHKVKDPVNPGTWIFKDTKVIVFEGLYLMLKERPWDQIPQIVVENESSIPIKVVKVYGGDAAIRVAQRHLDSGMVSTFEGGLQKYNDNDCINAELVQRESADDLIDYIVDNSRNDDSH